MFETFKAAVIDIFILIMVKWLRNVKGIVQSNEPTKKFSLNATVALGSKKRFSIFRLIGFMVCNFTVGFTLSALINLIFSRSKKLQKNNNKKTPDEATALYLTCAKQETDTVSD